MEKTIRKLTSLVLSAALAVVTATEIAHSLTYYSINDISDCSSVSCTMAKRGEFIEIEGNQDEIYLISTADGLILKEIRGRGYFRMPDSEVIISNIMEEE